MDLPRGAVNEKAHLSAAAVDIFLETQVATVALPNSSAATETGIRPNIDQDGQGNPAAGLGPEIDLGWGQLQQETADQRERRVRMNIRFLGATPINRDTRRADIEPVTEHQQRDGGFAVRELTSNEKFLERQTEMFGEGSMGRGGAGKPRYVKVGQH